MLKSGELPPDVYRELWETISGGGEWQGEYHNKKKDGQLYWVSSSISPIKNAQGVITHFLAVEEDRTELDSVNREVRRLTLEVLHTEDRERRKLARDLHDSTAQLLTGISMNIGRLNNMISNGEQRRLLSETLALSKQCIGEIRALSYGLHPPLLGELGLVTAVRLFARGFGERAGLGIDVKAPASFERLDGEMELALFRIVQEAIINVHRHSGSPRADIEFGQDSKEVSLTIRDFGLGMAGPRTVAANGSSSVVDGVGLSGMRERAEEFGGRLEIASTPNGAVLTITLPLVKSNEAASRVNC